MSPAQITDHAAAIANGIKEAMDRSEQVVPEAAASVNFQVNNSMFRPFTYRLDLMGFEMQPVLPGGVADDYTEIAEEEETVNYSGSSIPGASNKI